MLCISLMVFACGCRGNNSNNVGDKIVNDAENLANDAADKVEGTVDKIEKSIFPAELEEKDSEYFKVTSSSVKDNMVTLTGTVMKKLTGNDGGTEYEYGKQDTEVTFDANNADITFYDEVNANDSTVKFSSYLETYKDKIKDKIFKIKVDNGVITAIEEADYQDAK